MVDTGGEILQPQALRKKAVSLHATPQVLQRVLSYTEVGGRDLCRLDRLERNARVYFTAFDILICHHTALLDTHSRGE
jgi:hypothetical protein